jgi:hypothetical protein
MTTFTRARSQSFKDPHRPTIAVHFSLSVINTAILAIVACLGVWYLVQVNLTMSKNYQIRDLQKQLSVVETEARSNQIKLTQSETVSNLTSQAASLGMVPVGSVEYVTHPTSGMALR